MRSSACSPTARSPTACAATPTRTTSRTARSSARCSRRCRPTPASGSRRPHPPLLLAAEQPALLGLHGLAHLGRELAHQLFLPRGELLGDLDLELQHMVAAPALADARDALAAPH